ncbi:MAG: copper chaperone PCu(A)C [Paracoccus sp. (in: a-proteobacteria)]|uniref:copper chaperone PCu(A)C n=1 Tax=Paracoccus sp. TaxID=267 RepID=UPI0026DF2021|nr:copper chaperone PCu(A)C [Paracoccus sp. (in: a-proteobacteria)]MDO5630842.1 copper chaperone PCu(A)C [Paracoccus sp. (in: a-proteobacteria)]
MKTLTFAACAALFPVAVLAHDAVAVTDAYARSSNPQTGAAFMLLDNHREVDCTLGNVTSDLAERTEMHTHREVDGVMKMVPIEGGITIPAGEVHPMQRGADHVMFLGLHQPLKDGDVVRFTLDFGDCGTVDVKTTVDNARQPDAAPAAGHTGH